MKPTALFCTLLLAGSGLAQIHRGIDEVNTSIVSIVDSSYWQLQNTGISGVTPYAISAVNENVCWLAGGSGKIVCTIDGGNTWSLVNSGIIGLRDIYAFEGISDSTALAGTTTFDIGTFIHRTTNGGSTWELVASQPAGFIFAIKMFNPTKGIAVGDPVGGHWMILKTTNGGETWSRIATEPPQISGASGGAGFGVLDTSYVWFFDNAGRQYWSNDGGETWSYSSSPGSGTCLYWWNSRYLALCVTPMTVYRYEFGWTAMGPPPRVMYPMSGLVGASGTREFWLAQDMVYYTPNAASSWTSVSPHGLNKRVGLIDMVTLGSEVSAWATGTGDTVYHYHRIITDIDVPPVTVPDEFSLSQNFPNPFNPSTRIGFSVRGSRYVSLKVFDLLGREVATLVDEELAAGKHSVEWKPDGLSSGMYICRIATAGATLSKKMLLLR